MIDVTFDVESLRKVIRQEVRLAVKEALRERQLPILLSVAEAAELLGISTPKMHQVVKIDGFPVTYDFGHAKIPSDLLLKWIKRRTNKGTVYDDAI